MEHNRKVILFRQGIDTIEPFFAGLKTLIARIQFDPSNFVLTGERFEFGNSFVETTHHVEAAKHFEDRVSVNSSHEVGIVNTSSFEWKIGGNEDNVGDAVPCGFAFERCN